MSETRAPKSQNEPIQDLRQWLDAVEDIGELVKVSEPVNRDQEMSAIGYLLAKQQPSCFELSTQECFRQRWPLIR